MATTSRGWRKVSDSENDKAQAVNDALDDASADMTALNATLQAQIGNVSNTGGSGNSGATETNIVVPANKIPWTDTGVTLDFDVLILEASGEIAHGAGVTPYGPYNQGGAYLTWLLVTDGSTPDGNVPGQIDYRVQRTAHKRSGRLWLHVRDAGGAGDNSGSFTIKVRVWDDLVSVLAPLSELAGLRDSINVLSSRVSQLEQAQSGA